MRETPQPTTSSPAGPPHDHTPGASAPLPPSTEIDTIRQSSTRLYRNSCPPARTRARRPLANPLACPPARGVPSRHSREGGNPFSRHGLPGPQRVGRIAWSCRPLAVTPIDRTDPARTYRHKGVHKNTPARRRLTERIGWDMVAAALCEGASKSAESPVGRLVLVSAGCRSFGALPA